ncbi:MAG TPA: carbonic anhydrase [Candidatus Binataceae bacterium]|nr:carbonic anhydrase [Candidatus Binataceae bacterium]
MGKAKTLGFALIAATLAVIPPAWAANVKPTMSAARALQLLLDGNQRFIAGRLDHPDQSRERREEVAKGQHPFASVLSCSDSRVPPEVIFDQGLGDLFVVRVAGNVATDITIQSLDYSVKHLGVRVVMILGHTECGAVKAAILGHDEEGDVGPLLSELKPAVADSKGQPGDPVTNAVRENVKLVMQKLEESPELSAMVKTGELRIIGGVYNLKTGKIDIL